MKIREKKELIALLPIALLIIGTICFYYYQFNNYNKQTLDIIPIDSENSLVTQAYRYGGNSDEWYMEMAEAFIPKQYISDWYKNEYYITRVHIDKGEIWKTQVNKFCIDEVGTYSRYLKRSVILKDNAVSLYYHNESYIYKLNYDTGTLMKKLEMPYKTFNTDWECISDSNTIYFLRAKNRNERKYEVCAVDFDSLNIKWTTEIPNTKQNYFEYPIQNNNWIVSNRVYLFYNIRIVNAINKKTGKLYKYNLIDSAPLIKNAGYLVGDNYYAVTNKDKGLANNDKNENLVFTKIDLNTGKQTPLFAFNDTIDDKLNYRELLLWNYKDMVIYPSHNSGNISLKARNHNTGKLIWKIPLPEGFTLSKIPNIHKYAPELSPFPNITTPYLAFDVMKQNTEGISKYIKVLSIDLNKGKIAWESREQFLSRDNNWRYMLFDSSYVFIYPDGYLSVSGNTGKVDSYVNIVYSDKNIDWESEPYNQVYKSIKGRTFTLNDRAVFDIKSKTIKGKLAKGYIIKDLYDENKKRWGFE